MSDDIITELIQTNDVLRAQMDTFKTEVENQRKKMKLLEDQNQQMKTDLIDKDSRIKMLERLLEKHGIPTSRKQSQLSGGGGEDIQIDSQGPIVDLNSQLMSDLPKQSELAPLKGDQDMGEGTPREMQGLEVVGQALMPPPENRVSQENEDEIEEQKQAQQTEQDKKHMINIQFQPGEEFGLDASDEIYIVGEFNQWAPEIMEKQGGVFSYQKEAISGFKYRYQFVVQGNMIIDFTKPFSESKMGTLTNFYEIHGVQEDVPMEPKAQDWPQLATLPSYIDPHSQKITAPLKTDLLDQNLLTQQSKPLIDNEEVKRLDSGQPILPDLGSLEMKKSESVKTDLYQLMQRADILLQTRAHLQAKMDHKDTDEEEKEELKLQFQEADKEHIELSRIIKEQLTGKYVYSFDMPPITYKITEYRSTENTVYIRRFFDESNIKLNQEKAFSTNNRCLDFNEYFSSFLMFSSEEEKEFLGSVGPENIIDIHYKVEEFDGEIECLPMEIKPDRLSMAHYDLKFDKNEKKIINVINKKFGAVEFTQKQIDSAVNFVFGSEFIIYTAQFQPGIVNIIHILLDDMSESVSIKAEYIEDGKSMFDYATNPGEVDAAGQVLRYLILVRDERIYSVLYNTGKEFQEIQFEERRFEKDQIVKITDSSNPNSKVQNGRITHFPICMLASKDKAKLNTIIADTVKNPIHGHSNARYFERLPGYIDLDIIGDDGNLIEQPLSVAYPISFCQKLSQEDEATFQSLLDQKDKQKFSSLMQSFKDLQQAIDDYEANKPEDVDTVNQVFAKIKSCEENLSSQVETQEVNVEFLESIKILGQKASHVLRGLATEMRMMRFRK